MARATQRLPPLESFSPEKPSQPCRPPGPRERPDRGDPVFYFYDFSRSALWRDISGTQLNSPQDFNRPKQGDFVLIHSGDLLVRCKTVEALVGELYDPDKQGVAVVYVNQVGRPQDALMHHAPPPETEWCHYCRYRVGDDDRVFAGHLATLLKQWDAKSPFPWTALDEDAAISLRREVTEYLHACALLGFAPDPAQHEKKDPIAVMLDQRTLAMRLPCDATRLKSSTKTLQSLTRQQTGKPKKTSPTAIAEALDLVTVLRRKQELDSYRDQISHTLLKNGLGGLLVPGWDGTERLSERDVVLKALRGDPECGSAVRRAVRFWGQAVFPATQAFATDVVDTWGFTTTAAFTQAEANLGEANEAISAVLESPGPVDALAAAKRFWEACDNVRGFFDTLKRDPQRYLSGWGQTPQRSAPGE